MLSDNAVRSVVDSVMLAAKGSDVEVTLFESDESLTRFANNEIHQNVAEQDASLLVRVAQGKRVGVVSLNRADPEGARQATERAAELARHQVENPDYAGMPGAEPAGIAPGPAAGTLAFGADRRAHGVQAVVSQAMAVGLTAAGAFSTGHNRVTLANSNGAFQQHESTRANLNTVVMSATSSGFGDHTAADATEIDAEAVGARAVRKAVESQAPRSLEPGAFTVVLEEPAVADLLDFLAYEGFGAQAVQEGRSFMSGRFGQQVVGSNVSIWDDGLASDTLAMPFDYEGVPRQRVDLIRQGVAVSAVYDRATAAKEHRASTGHALPAGRTFGPIPLHLRLGPGTASVDDLLAGVERGVLVTRFWYTRTVHPLTVTVTGMTRDGTFLVEDGRVVGAVRNLRFTQSYLEALRNVEAIGRDTKLVREFGGANRVPALRIAGWNFTGSTE